MAFYGDLIMPRSGFLGGIIGIPMSTAIARTHTAEGFVIGADGRVLDSDDRSIRDDRRQKIFPLGGNNFLACSFTGAVELGPDGSTAVLFSLVDQIAIAAETIQAAKCGSLYEYAQRLAKPIGQALKRTLLTEQIQLPEERRNDSGAGFDIVDILIDGYFKYSASRVKIKFHDQNQTVANPEIFREELYTGHVSLHGLPEVGDLLQARDARFAKYLRPVNTSTHKSGTVRETITLSRAFIVLLCYKCKLPSRLIMKVSAANWSCESGKVLFRGSKR